MPRAEAGMSGVGEGALHAAGSLVYDHDGFGLVDDDEEHDDDDDDDDLAAATSPVHMHAGATAVIAPQVISPVLATGTEAVDGGVAAAAAVAAADLCPSSLVARPPPTAASLPDPHGVDEHSIDELLIALFDHS
jgi:hypothetical protein